MTSERVTPRATYRLQLRPGFGFDQVAELAPYLAALGVSHVYLSPILQAAPGSTHGYDVIDHGRVSDDLGGPPAHARMCAALAEAGLSQVLDIVPNHMSIATHQNRWWWDVLEKGPASRWAGHFDVDWNPTEERIRNKVLLPILAERYGKVLESGAIQLVREGATFTLRAGERVLPVALASLAEPLRRAAAVAGSEELAFLADAIAALPAPRLARQNGEQERHHRDLTVLRRMLGRLYEEMPRAATATDEVLGELNADPDRLDAVLEQQNYRLAFWRAARHDLDYRRFFDIDTLAGLRMSEERVFQETHALVTGWVQAGRVDGLRVDHPDGLREPELYFRRLRQAAPRAWIVVEKILARDEPLPETWPVDGTTGYEFAVLTTGLLVDPDGEAPLTGVWARFLGEEPPEMGRLAREKKRRALAEMFSPDLNRLVAALVSICEANRRWRDFTRPEMREALAEVLACLTVYRTYVRPGEPATDRDAATIQAAIERARESRPGLDPDLLALVRNVLSGFTQGPKELGLLLRFQQLSGAVMAKGVEDTALYCHQRLLCLNEVGGDPGRFGEPPAAFHAWCQRVQQRWPRTMLGTSTHDTKRSEDVRARLALLSELPGPWEAAVRRWSERAERHRQGRWPDRATEYFFWQTLVGASPIPLERLWPYMEKAAREAKLHTSWTSPEAEYEGALRGFVAGVLGDEELLADVAAFVEPLRRPGWLASLATLALKLTAPGVPDVYQGNEVWDLSLTDPDNRRPVDFEARRRLLERVRGLGPEDAMRELDQGGPKMWLLLRGLELRARRPECFGPASSYQPLEAAGRFAPRLVAFARGGQVVAVVPRLLVAVERDGWDDTTVALPPGEWRSALGRDPVAGGPQPVAELLRRFPVAILERA